MPSELESRTSTSQFTIFYVFVCKRWTDFTQLMQNHPIPGGPGVGRGIPGGGGGRTGRPGDGRGTFWGRTFRVNGLRTPRLSTKSGVQELVSLRKSASTSINLNHSQSLSATGASQTGVRPVSRNHPSSRAGDQDEVSSQANSLKT